MGNGPLERQLQFEKKNQNLVKLPKYAKVEKRPIPHAPVASPYAGASVPKVVYISTGTPFMSAVKRVQKLLRQAEKRATANISLEDSRKTEQQKLSELAKVAEKREEVFVKATGRAIEKALNVGKWFEEKEAEYTARVKTGSVLVVDDVVEDEEKKEREMQKQQREEGAQQTGQQKSQEKSEEKAKSAAKKKKKRPASAISEDTELPETRTRWIKMVEVAAIKDRARSEAIALNTIEAKSFMMPSLMFDSSYDTQPQPQDHQRTQVAFKPQWRRKERFH